MAAPRKPRLFLRGVRRRLIDDEVCPPGQWPRSMPWVDGLDLEFRSPVTFLVGENGSGKSSLLEALAVHTGFPPGGGGTNEISSQHAPDEEHPLADLISTTFHDKKGAKAGYFFRAEFLAHFADLLDRRAGAIEFRASDPYQRYGGKSLFEQSHGESFLSVLQHRVQSGLYLVDEPESALSPARQLTLLALLADRATRSVDRCQFVIATHSPILLTMPGATIRHFEEPGLPEVSIEDTDHYQITRGILERPGSYWRHLSAENPGAGDAADDDQ